MDECDMGIRFCRKLQCENTIGTYTCGCRQGYEKVVSGNEYACVDIDECKNKRTCPINAACENRNGDYSCTCEPGFEGEFCLDVDECSTNKTSCDVNANCVNTPGSFRCACRRGYFGTGLFCEKGQCQDSVCADNKVCSALTTIDCVCKQGFVDGLNDTCDDIDECLLENDCDVNAECTNMPGGYSCDCADDFHGNGTICLEGECMDSNCPVNEQCISPRGLDCQCKDGFYHDESKKCVDIDECENTNNCHWNAACSNTEGSYFCECKPGFYGNGLLCLEGDCVDAACPGNQTCISSTSICDCSEGLNKIGRHCFDIDECSLGIHDCHKNLECINFVGDFACKPHCKKGFKRSYDGNCQDIDECASSIHYCSSEEKCINNDGGFSCKERLFRLHCFHQFDI